MIFFFFILDIGVFFYNGVNFLEFWQKVSFQTKMTLMEVVKKDMLINKIIESMTLDKKEWHKRIYVVDLD